MKTLFSFLMIFSFLCLQAQENDTDGDGILDKDDACPIVFGYFSGYPSENGCKKITKKKYTSVELEKIKNDFLEDIKNLDFKYLADFIVPKIDVNIFKDELIIFKLYEPECGNCDEGIDNIETMIRREIIYTKFWNDYTFRKLLHQFPKKQFVPWCSYDCFIRMPFLKEIKHSELVVNSNKESPMYVFNLNSPTKYDLDEIGYQTNSFTMLISLKRIN